MAFPLPEPMRLALAEARDAEASGEVPVGAVIMRDGEVIARAHNGMGSTNDPTAHAEIVALRAAAAALDTPRLDGCDLWVTLEPCTMCAGAISLARIKRLYFAAPDPKAGGVIHGSRFFSQPTCHHVPDVYSGMGEEEAAKILRAFFQQRR